jgi:hypothetical protein
MTCIVHLNILIYICLSIFSSFFISIINFFYHVISVSLSGTQDRHVIWTYLISGSRISHINSQDNIYFNLFFILLPYFLFFIIKLIKI